METRKGLQVHDNFSRVLVPKIKRKLLYYWVLTWCRSTLEVGNLSCECHFLSIRHLDLTI